MRRPQPLPKFLLDAIRAEVATIGHLLSPAFRFRLAWFQRAHAWTADHALLLLDSIEEAMDIAADERRWLNLNTISIVQRDGSDHVIVTDGQQRLLTLTILVAILRDFAETDTERRELHDRLFGAPTAEEPKGYYRFEPHPSTKGLLVDYVLTPGATKKAIDDNDEDELSFSGRNILACRDAMWKRVKDMSVERRRALAAFLAGRCCVIVQIMASEEDARVAYCNAHSMGVHLSPADMFKAETLSVIARSARKSASRAWEQWQAKLGPEAFEELLRAMLTIERKRYGKPRQLYEDLNKAFRLEEPDGAEQFVLKRLPRAAELLHAIKRADIGRAGAGFAPINRRLQYLGWVTHRTWVPAAMSAIQQLGDRPDALLAFLARLDRLAYTQMVLGRDGDLQQRRYVKLLQASDANDPALVVGRDEQREMLAILRSSRVVRPRFKVMLLLRINGAVEGDGAPVETPMANIEHVL
ncbi:MAG TPA: DUF262 domain-containing protein, partial [Hyphomicrobiaceae bacterium]|nr:DUF262 domain-containing protein [Hyphomicrobiaceae bacterium]